VCWKEVLSKGIWFVNLEIPDETETREKNSKKSFKIRYAVAHQYCLIL